MTKKIILAALALASAAAYSATLTPVQLLNPTGSTSGQTIVSTGASTPPNWGNVPVANVTGAAPLASPAFTGLASITNSGTSGDTLTILSSNNTAQGADILLQGNGITTPNKRVRAFGGTFQVVNSANSAVITQVDDSGNLSSIANINASGSLTLSQTAGIIGTTTNNNASAGSVGEYPTPTNLSAVSLTSGTAANVSSASLTAGDYDVECTANFTPAASTTFGNIQIGVNTTSATQPGLGGYTLIQAPLTTGLRQTIKSGAVRVLLASTTTVYCVSTSTFGVSTMTSDGFMRIRRVR